MLLPLVALTSKYAMWLAISESPTFHLAAAVRWSAIETSTTRRALKGAVVPWRGAGVETAEEQTWKSKVVGKPDVCIVVSAVVVSFLVELSIYTSFFSHSCTA